MSGRNAWLVALVWLWTGCLQNQHNGVVAIDGDACVTCHQVDYDGAQNPVHVGTMPTSCGDCHTETAWRPARGGHPEPSFPLQTGAHTGIGCLSCHDNSLGNSSAGGANTNCTQAGCHPRAMVDPIHPGVSGYAWSETRPNFCLSCHPSGEGAVHPEAAFPITAGPHAPVACASCHIASAGPSTGGMNVSCIDGGCHLRADVDDDHDEVGGYVWSSTDKDFCRRCHPQGRN